MDKDMDTEARKILVGAANLIDKHGLAKGNRHNGLGAFCAHGAIAFTTHGDAYQDSVKTSDAVGLLKKYLISKDPKIEDLIIYGVGPWNNKDHMTAQDVISAMRAAADFTPAM